MTAAADGPLLPDDARVGSMVDGTLLRPSVIATASWVDFNSSSSAVSQGLVRAGTFDNLGD